MVQIVNMGERTPVFEQLAQGLVPSMQMSLANKMQALSERRELAFQQKQFEAKQKQMEQQASIADSIHPGLGMAHRLLGPQGLAKAISELGGIEEVANQFTQSQPYSKKSIDALSPKRTQFDYENQLIPMQDREALEEQQEVAPVERFEAQPTSYTPKLEVPKGTEVRTLDDYRRKIAPNYDKLGKSAKESVDRRAEREFNAQMSLRKEKRAEKTAIEKKQAPFLKSVRESARAAQQSNKALDEIEKILPHVGPVKSTVGRISAINRQAVGRLESTSSSLFPAFKTMFPRGFTGKEFDYIGSHWVPSPYNTEETNRGIIEGHRNFNKWALKRDEILNSFMDEEGNLPDNVENLVERQLGEQYQKDKYQMLVEPGQKAATPSIIQDISKLTGLKGEELVNEVERRGYVFPNS